MNDRGEFEPDDGDRYVTDDLSGQGNVLEHAFNLNPDTAQLVEDDEAATGMRKPSANSVDEARAAEARATEPRKSEPA